MELIALLMLGCALIGAAAGRWTGIHPLVSGLILWLLGGALATLVFAGFMSPAALPAGLLSGLVSGAAAALGAFMGRLRRQHLRRIS